jgi:hypothetical protein
MTKYRKKKCVKLKYRNGGVVTDIIQELISLALLPPNRIYEEFEVYT